MRLLIIILFVGSCFGVAQAQETSAFVTDANAAVHRDVFTECSRVLRPVMYATQAWDAITSAHVYAKGGVEEDWLTGAFAGHRHPRTSGMIIEQAALDIIAGALTRHSAAARCAVEARQVDANLSGIIYTAEHPH